MDEPRLIALNWRIRQIDEEAPKWKTKIEYYTDRLTEAKSALANEAIERDVLHGEIQRIRNQP